MGEDETPDAAPSRGSRLARDVRRSQILESAGRLFRTRPAASVSMEAVAKEAGVTVGLIYHYFRGRRDLQLAVIREMFRAAPPVPDYVQGATPADRLDQSTTLWLDMVEVNRETWLATIAAEGLGRDPEVEDMLDRVRDRAVDGIIAVLGIGPPDQVSSEARAVLRSFGGFAEAATREWLEYGRVTRAQVHAMLTTTLLALVDQVIPVVDASVAAPPARPGR
jgi:AcrR family transcriptional regulator